jgi:hypothetical protein
MSRTARELVTLPTLFIIGAAKAGTTSLHYYLDQHPEIQMSATKEPNFFSGPEDGLPYPLGRVETLADYERLFESAAPVRGEASVCYTHYPRRKGVPERIKECVPGAKFLYVVRDPIARSVSQYRYSVAVEGERRSVQEVLRGFEDPSSPCVCPSRYATQLELYLRHFPQDSVLVVDHADLHANRRSTLSEIFRFLSVDETVDSSQFDEELNATRDHRMVPSSYTRIRAAGASAAVSWVPSSVRRPTRRAIERLLWPPLQDTTLDSDLSQRLAEHYAGEMERLRALTGKSFPTWTV